MFSIRPIKQIKGLFSSYKNEQPVPADEYNANIRCMQQAIEHNGQLLEEHSEAFESLAKEKLPNNSVQTDLIADGAVTADKLSPDIRQYCLLSSDAISGYFKDFLLQHHKSKPDMQGVFMNGAITNVGQTLTRQTTYTKNVEYFGTQRLTVRDPDGRYEYSEYTIPYTSTAAPEKYRIEVPNYYPDTYHNVKETTQGWKTIIVLDQAYDINTETDSFNAHFNFFEGGYPREEYVGTSTATVSFKDISGNTVATINAVADADYYTTQNNYNRRGHNAKLSSLSAQVLQSVKSIEIVMSCSVRRRSNYDPLVMVDDMQPHAPSINLRFGTGTSEQMVHEISVPSVNSINSVAIGAYVKATTTVDFDTYKLNMAPYCTGECPYQPAPGFEAVVLAYVNETADSEYSAVLTDANAKRYYIRHDFQAPLIVSARIKEDKPADLHPDFIAGEYYSWPLHFIDNSYIAYTNLNEVVQDLKEYFSDYLEDITYTEYSLGNTQLGLQFNTTTNNITIESVSVAKYLGLTKPNLI